MDINSEGKQESKSTLSTNNVPEIASIVIGRQQMCFVFLLSHAF